MKNRYSTRSLDPAILTAVGLAFLLPVGCDQFGSQGSNGGNLDAGNSGATGSSDAGNSGATGSSDAGNSGATGSSGNGNSGAGGNSGSGNGNSGTSNLDAGNVDASDFDASTADANDFDAQAVAQEPVPLGLSSTFAILASAGITNIPTSEITGDVGLTPDAASNISGFSMPVTCPEVTGTVYVVDATGPACATIDPTILTDAKADARVAFINARAAVRGTPQAVSGNLNGLTLYPGLYESGTSLEVSAGGFLYLDAQGDQDAVFIIRSETSITTEDTSEVVLTGDAKATNVYWTAGSTVTLGTDSIMKGTMIAGTSISLLSGANLEGRALNQGAAAEAITLDACTITLPSP
jgi:hypothetical protein